MEVLLCTFLIKCHNRKIYAKIQIRERFSPGQQWPRKERNDAAAFVIEISYIVDGWLDHVIAVDLGKKWVRRSVESKKPKVTAKFQKYAANSVGHYLRFRTTFHLIILLRLQTTDLMQGNAAFCNAISSNQIKASTVTSLSFTFLSFAIRKSDNHPLLSHFWFEGSGSSPMCHCLKNNGSRGNTVMRKCT